MRPVLFETTIGSAPAAIGSYTAFVVLTLVGGAIALLIGLRSLGVGPTPPAG